MMFRQRLLTAIILVPFILFAIYYANNLLFASLVMLFVIGCGAEWIKLIPLARIPAQLIFIILLSTFMILSQYGFSYWLITGLFIWGGMSVAIIFFPRSQVIWGYRLIVACTAFVFLPLFGRSLIELHSQSQGKDLLIYLLFFIWASDVGAYLAGKQWGRSKLIPLVSPGKTWQGVVGGLVCSLFVAVCGYYYFHPFKLVHWFVINMVTVVIAIFGDLFISMLKRRVNIKDTGKLLPGHGGILDRLDSLIAALPLFYCGLRFWPPGF